MATGRPLSSAASAAPYRLRAILYEYDIKQAELCERLTYTRGNRKGQTLSDSTVSSLLTRRQWPITTPESAPRPVPR